MPIRILLRPPSAVGLYLVILFMAMAACGGNTGGDAASSRDRETQAGPENIYTCSSANASDGASRCVSPRERAEKLAADIVQWQPPMGPWLSSMFELRAVQNKYALTKNETRCLIQTFCKERVK